MKTCETTQSNEFLVNDDLHRAINHQIQSGLENSRVNKNKTKEAFITACITRYYDIARHIDWTIPRRTGEVKSFPGNFSSAIQYAQLVTGGDITRNYETESPVQWCEVIDSVLSTTKARDVFVANFWRSPMVVRPKRAIPLQYILPHFFGDNPISGIDIGAGLHVALPLLNSDIFISPQFVEQQRLIPKPINLQFGIGVDKQTRELNWAVASEEPSNNATTRLSELRLIYQTAIKNDTKFPFISADALELENTLPHKSLDFAFTSFLRHQLGTDINIQSRFLNQVGCILKEGGIWVDIGKEFVKPPTQGKIYHEYDVDVYRIVNSKPEFIGTPFTLQGNQIDIQNVNLDFFKGT